MGTSLNPEAYVKSISYTATGKRQKIVYGNGVETSYEYDPVRDAIKQIKTTKAGGEVLQDLTYSFDKVGNISSLVNGADLGTTAYQYDSLDRLTSSVASGFTNAAMNYSRTIDFANNGNILNKSDIGSYGWSTSVNQLLTVGNRSMVWDGVGNLSSRTILTNSESHLQQFSYDVHNNLSFFTNAHEFDGGGNWVKYSYDYSGQRLRRWSYSGNETIYPNKFYSIKNSKWTNNHIYAGKERICTLVNGEPSFIHRDQINSGGLITTNGGQVGDKITFAPYVEILYQANTNASTGSATPPLEEGFTGQILDPETGLYYYNARYYDPKIGIFISADTIVPDPYSSQDFNRYMYVKGNPVKYSDPTGHSSETSGGGIPFPFHKWISQGLRPAGMQNNWRPWLPTLNPLAVVRRIQSFAPTAFYFMKKAIDRDGKILWLKPKEGSYLFNQIDSNPDYRKYIRELQGIKNLQERAIKEYNGFKFQWKNSRDMFLALKRVKVETHPGGYVITDTFNFSFQNSKTSVRSICLDVLNNTAFMLQTFNRISTYDIRIIMPKKRY